MALARVKTLQAQPRKAGYNWYRLLGSNQGPPDPQSDLVHAAGTRTTRHATAKCCESKAFHDSDPLIPQAGVGSWTQEASSAGVPQMRGHSVPKFIEGFADRLQVPDGARDI